MHNLTNSKCTCELKLVYSNKLIRIKKVQEITGLSKSYIYQLVKQEIFPSSILLIEGGSAVAWLESDVLDWVESRVLASKTGVA